MADGEAMNNLKISEAYQFSLRSAMFYLKADL